MEELSWLDLFMMIIQVKIIYANKISSVCDEDVLQQIHIFVMLNFLISFKDWEEI